jgi:hypothetical protein
MKEIIEELSKKTKSFTVAKGSDVTITAVLDTYVYIKVIAPSFEEALVSLYEKVKEYRGDE